MSVLIAYRRRASSLHAARASVGALYGLALGTAALIVQHPVVLVGLLGAVLLAGAACGAGRDMAHTLRVLGLPILLLTVLVNVLVSRNGLTVFARLGYFGPFGQMNLTVEAAAYGLLVGSRLLIVMLAAVLVSSTVDPDELLRSLRRVYPRSALAATVATRLVPVLARDAERLADAQRCRGDGGVAGVRARLGILRAVVAGSLDRSLDVAATLEVRGYGSGGRPARPSRARSRHDLNFALAAAATLAAAIGTRVSGMASFDVYPLMRLPLGPAALLSALLVPVLALAPFLDRRGVAL
ncbi:MAG TPA: energy-coupling factor transporter transmembrane component T [Solirubrobacteraceae bacterium]|nr:energy-coupling factor transporter transmembrane component T [Solirubrobacteraceae bacterium]